MDGCVDKGGSRDDGYGISAGVEGRKGDSGVHGSRVHGRWWGGAWWCAGLCAERVG